MALSLEPDPSFAGAHTLHASMIGKEGLSHRACRLKHLSQWGKPPQPVTVKTSAAAPSLIRLPLRTPLRLR